MSKVAVIGGGAAGMICAVGLGRAGHETVLFERNEKTGKKLFITGKGRCNLTNDCDTTDFFESVIRNPKFLYSAVYGFDHDQVKAFFEGLGVSLKTERGQRVFPASDHSSDIIRALDREMIRLGVSVRLNTFVMEITKASEQFRVVTKDGEEVFDKVVVATGGLSYPQTGSDGDGYRFAKSFGLKVTETSPSLVPMEIRETELFALQGLSLRNVSLKFTNGKKILREEFGEMLFTHFGISGPLVLSASAYMDTWLKKSPQGVSAQIDLKPALSEEQLDKRILREFEEAKNKDFRNALSGLYPSKLVPVIVSMSGIDPYIKVHDITKEQRSALVRLTKAFPFTVTGLRGYKEAVITKGGVDVREIDPSTMESKKVSGLYFIGEVLDVDALTGGFNLQIAWSTGMLCALGMQ